jgi:hypothetical protein
MKTLVFWAVTPCIAVDSDDTHMEFCLLDPEDGREQCFSPKRRFIPDYVAPHPKRQYSS